MRGTRCMTFWGTPELQYISPHSFSEPIASGSMLSQVTLWPLETTPSVMMLFKKAQCLKWQPFILLIVSSRLVVGSVVSNSSNAVYANISISEDLRKSTSSWTIPSLNTSIVWPSPTVTTLPPQNLTLANEPSVESEILKTFISCSCDPLQRLAIMIAWSEAKELTRAVSICSQANSSFFLQSLYSARLAAWAAWISKK